MHIVKKRCGNDENFSIIGLELYQETHGVAAACALEDRILDMIPVVAGRIDQADIDLANAWLREQDREA